MNMVKTKSTIIPARTHMKRILSTNLQLNYGRVCYTAKVITKL